MTLTAQQLFFKEESEYHKQKSTLHLTQENSDAAYRAKAHATLALYFETALHTSIVEELLV